MPRYPEGQRQQTRGRVVTAAAALLRERGLAGVSVQAVMQAADLTHGGFYAHFGSRDALVLAALEEAAGEKLRALLLHARTQPDPLAAFVRGYLSRTHRDHPAHGCPLPSLSAEVSRGENDLKEVLARGVEVFVSALRLLSPSMSEAHAQALMAGMVGSLMLARALPDPGASDALLHNARHTLLDAFRPRA